MLNLNSTSASSPNDLLRSSLEPSSGDVEERETEENNDNDSSGTTPIKATKTGDRSRTLVSERKRRGQMKEKLYTLRSLVPNISKMDKASIIGDAVKYVQELQVRANALQSEVSALEPLLNAALGKPSGLVENKMRKDVIEHRYIPMEILQMNVFQVAETGFHVKLVSNKGAGTAVCLQKALESLTCFDIQSSNIATVSETLILTFTFNITEFAEELNLSTLKLWIVEVFMHQGFEFNIPF